MCSQPRIFQAVASPAWDASWNELGGDNALKLLQSVTLWNALCASLACFPIGMQQAPCRHDVTGFRGLKQGYATLQTECYDRPMICSTSPKQSLDQLFVDSFAESRFVDICRYLFDICWTLNKVSKRLLRHFTQRVLRCWAVTTRRWWTISLGLACVT